VPSQSKDLEQVLATLGHLKQRIRELDSADPQVQQVLAQASTSVAGRDALTRLRAGLAELDGLTRPEEVPAFFGRLAARTGLRMLLLKQWRSGLQVCAERNVVMPPEAKNRRPDGRAPIPSDPDNLFAAVARERQVYAGPVPIKAFPLDLTLLLGRGAQERRIVVLPLPAREHWSTFVYLDGEPGQEAELTVAEFLARHAVDRLRLWQRGDLIPEGEVAAMLKQELHRRRSRLQKQTESEGPDLGTEIPDAPSAAPADATGVDQAEEMTADLELDWLHREDVSGDQEPAPRTAAAGGPSSRPNAAEHARTHGLPASALRMSQAQAEADAIVQAWEEAVLGAPTHPVSIEQASLVAAPMAPEDILHQSGDLPAMPKAALHILSVIEDPRTTATRLERAVAMDQALTAKILRIANSPFYGAVREIKTVSEAIVRLGFVTIRNWTLVTATRSVFLGAGAGLLFQKIWRQSVLSAMAAQLVAQSVRRAEPETVFVGGLMQNIGQLVLARSHLDLFQQVLTVSAAEGLPYHVVEQELLGFDHGDLGALLIKEWNLSEDLEQGVRWHHRLDHPDIRCRDLAAMIALGEDIAACTSSADAEADDLRYEHSRAAAVLGLSAAAFRRLRSDARDLSIDPVLFG
jgi:HD-like signal output (HDOD) protein